MPHPVYIVGAGPGDPELLTRKAYRLITEAAEVVVYDRLVPEPILAVIPARVEKIYAGKSCKTHHLTQEEINAELVRQAQRGKHVVRLKGGDPFIFGRGGEEVEYLVQHGIACEVVPGITSASGISCLHGIPLTHRGLAHSVRFITGHQQKGEKVLLDWPGLAHPETTLVVYMGLAHLAEIAAQLIQHGLDANTPAAAIENGTLPHERVCIAPLHALAEKVQEQEFQAPTLIIIGAVVGLAQRLGLLKTR